MPHRTLSRTSLVVASLMIAGACDGTSVDPAACTEISVAGINVAVTDAVTGSALGAGSTLMLRDGTYTETTDEVLGANILAGAWERPGNYEAFVERAGYEPWSQADVTVELTDDECHVVTVRLDAALTPAQS